MIIPNEHLEGIRRVFCITENRVVSKTWAELYQKLIELAIVEGGDDSLCDLNTRLIIFYMMDRHLTSDMVKDYELHPYKDEALLHIYHKLKKDLALYNKSFDRHVKDMREDDN